MRSKQGQDLSSDVAAEPRPGRGGMTRRQMIKAAAVTGAAAWTAPVIIDSLTSPAAAGSVCVKYYAKLDSSGSCVAHDPSCGIVVPSGTRYVCCSVDTSGEACPFPEKTPSFTTASNPNYYEITLQAGSYFSSSTTWQLAGNYNFNCVQLTGMAGASAPAGSYTGNGYFQTGGQKAWIKKSHDFGNGAVNFTYAYLQFCCGS